MQKEQIGAGSTIFVDAHVHIHSCSEWRSVLDSASLNFMNLASRKNASSNYQSVLMLTETAKARCFQLLLEEAAGKGSHETHENGHWRLSGTGESCSLMAESKSGTCTIVIAGRQIVSKENLEVLALGTDAFIGDGLPIREVIDKVLSKNALAVLPWGFGKWWGKRGEIVTDLLNSQRAQSILLGDNSGRAAILGIPRQFKMARDKQILILPGSDPLPFRSERWRPGSFGFTLNGVLDENYPTRDLIRLVYDNAVDIRPYGSLENPLRFVRNQIAMQFKKRAR